MHDDDDDDDDDDDAVCMDIIYHSHGSNNMDKSSTCFMEESSSV